MILHTVYVMFSKIIHRKGEQHFICHYKFNEKREKNPTTKKQKEKFLKNVVSCISTNGNYIFIHIYRFGDGAGNTLFFKHRLIHSETGMHLSMRFKWSSPMMNTGGL